MDDKKTMDTEAGGESTQYESIKTQTQPPAKQSGQLGGDLSHTTSVSSAVKQDKGESTAENIRYGQNISESGMGGMTNSDGSAGQEGGFGGAARDSTHETSAARKTQGYGPGTNVGG